MNDLQKTSKAMAERVKQKEKEIETNWQKLANLKQKDKDRIQGED